VSNSAKEKAIVSFGMKGTLLNRCVRQSARREAPAWVRKMPDVPEFRH
jgi:hypothetical protein